MNSTIKIEALTRTGERSENQDNFMLDRKVPFIQGDGEKTCEILVDEEIHVVVLCDGVGGAQGGGLAAIEVLDEIRICLEENVSDNLRTLAEEMLDRANERVIKIGEIFGQDLGTTISLLLWKGKDFLSVNVGDSPIYLLRDRKMKKLSLPHTLACIKQFKGEFVKDADHHVLINYLGRKGFLGSSMAHIVEDEFEADDKILMCSDGVTDAVSERKLEEHLQLNAREDNSDTFAALAQELNVAKLKDNSTFILVDLKPLNTQMFDKELGKCESEKELNDLMEDNQFLFQPWRDYITGKIEQFRKKHGISRGEIAQLCGVDAKTARNVMRGSPKKREHVICVGVMLGMDVETINFMLSKKAKFHKLYSKNLEDAIWLFIINHKQWTRKQGKSVLELYKEYKGKVEELQKKYAYEEVESVSTQYVNEYLNSEDSFETTMMKVLSVRHVGCQLLLDYIEDGFERTGSCVASLEYIGNEMKQKRSYYRRLEALRNEFEIPSRAFLIALGIHLEMNVMEIDRMLDLAGMVPLYSKDTVEGRLRFYLEMYQIENPELFADGAMDLRLGSYKEQDITLVKCIYKKMKRDQRQCKDEQIWKDIIELL